MAPPLRCHGQGLLTTRSLKRVSKSLSSQVVPYFSCSSLRTVDGRFFCYQRKVWITRSIPILVCVGNAELKSNNVVLLVPVNNMEKEHQQSLLCLRRHTTTNIWTGNLPFVQRIQEETPKSHTTWWQNFMLLVLHIIWRNCNVKES